MDFVNTVGTTNKDKLKSLKESGGDEGESEKQWTDEEWYEDMQTLPAGSGGSPAPSWDPASDSLNVLCGNAQC